MLKFGNVGQNALTLAILIGVGYLIYLKLSGKSGNAVKEKIQNLFSRGKI